MKNIQSRWPNRMMSMLIHFEEKAAQTKSNCEAKAFILMSSLKLMGSHQTAKQRLLQFSLFLLFLFHFWCMCTSVCMVWCLRSLPEQCLPTLFVQHWFFMTLFQPLKASTSISCYACRALTVFLSLSLLLRLSYSMCTHFDHAHKWDAEEWTKRKALRRERKKKITNFEFYVIASTSFSTPVVRI